eukprot:182705-Chlamydomonas_euryale.AAC.7
MTPSHAFGTMCLSTPAALQSAPPATCPHSVSSRDPPAPASAEPPGLQSPGPAEKLRKRKSACVQLVTGCMCTPVCHASRKLSHARLPQDHTTPSPKSPSNSVHQRLTSSIPLAH